MIDEGTLLVLKSASGAFTCRKPLIPKKWNPVDRPHVARLVSTGTDVMRVYLSNPKNSGNAPYNLENSIEHAYQGFHMISNVKELIIPYLKKIRMH